MRETLTTAGYEVDDARNGMEGLEKVRDFRPDLVLLDINMPEMGGVEVCKPIRRDSNIAIIMLTVRKSDADRSPRSRPAQTISSPNLSAHRSCSPGYARRFDAYPLRRALRASCSSGNWPLI